MTDIAIRVENLSKQYRIGGPQGRFKYKSLRESLTKAVQSPFRRAASLLRGQAYGAAEMDKTIWALKDVSFEVKRGEVVGIIGRNGAGKTTLLKVLSRITEPTGGQAVVYGRVGTLLEVGTGFHPELTGRENIYLSGAILGMKRAEIEHKFEEIVAFSGVEKFIDTPVKHYSSGMQVRLAFSVAAHLEPEILLVDEVLAVGDASFQKKCLGKMEKVAESGRTVLLVSHNMDAIKGLCSRAIWLDAGRKQAGGPADRIVREYLTTSSQRGEWQTTIAQRSDRVGDGRLRFTEVQLRDGEGVPVNAVVAGDSIDFVLSYVSAGESLRNVSVWFWIRDAFGRGMVALGSRLTGDDFDCLPPKGKLVCHVPRFPLRAGTYYVDLGADVDASIKADRVLRAVKLEVVAGDFFGTGQTYYPSYGDFLCEHSWRLSEGDECHSLRSPSLEPLKGDTRQLSRNTGRKTCD